MSTATAPRPAPAGPLAIHTPDQRLRVFVSSTLKELGEERAAVRAAVTRLRLTPVMFESAARAHPPSELYRAYERQSDVFIGVYWRSYGWVAPGAEVSGIEDEWTLADDLPRLVYLKQPGTDREPRLTDLLSRIRTDARTSYRTFSTPDDLQEMVENDLALLLTDRFMGDRLAEPWTEPSASRLPATVTCLVGRTMEVKAVRSLLGHNDVRLVTLTGPGGVGKSRLALEVARRAREDFPDGVRFVELASTTRPEMVATALADQLGVRSSSAGESVATMLERFLQTQRLLLVLDNFEQVALAAPLVTDLLAAAPGIKVLVTSRTVLHLRGEHDVVVPALGVSPSPGEAASGRSLVGQDALQLFAARARAVDPQFRLDTDNLAAVAEICRRLDGLPLAIELAASRVRLLPPRALLRRLRDGLGLVAAGQPDVPPRQRTLHDTITWSYDLLTSEEQRVLDSLAVFSGGFDLEALEALDRPSGDAASANALRTLGSLVDKSLVRALVVDEGRRRFGLLETIRAYAEARLEESGERDRVRDAHAEHYRQVAESAGQGLRRKEQRTWLRRLEREHNNLRAALDWNLERGDVESALRTSWGVWIFWWFGDIDEGARWFTSISDSKHPMTTHQHAQALTGAGLMGFARGDRRGAESALQQSLSLYRELSDIPGTALAAGALGHLTARRGDQDQAAGLLRESLDLYKDLGDDWYTAIMLNFLGSLSQARSDLGRAAEVFSEALALSRRVGGSVPLLMSLYNIAVTEFVRGERDAAAALFAEGLGRAVEIGDRASAAPYLAGLAASIAEQQPERACRLQGAAVGLVLAAGTVWLDAYTSHPPGYRPQVDTSPPRSRSALARAWTEGRDIAKESGQRNLERLADLAAERDAGQQPP